MERSLFILTSVGVKIETIRSELEDNSIIKSLVPPNLIGDDLIQQAEVTQWLTFSLNFHNDKDKIKEQQSVVDLFLYNKSYLVGNNFTIGDVAVYYLFYLHYDNLQVTQYPSLKRWFNHIQHLCYNNNKSIDVKVIPLSNTIIRVLPLDATAPPSASDPPPIPAKEDAKTTNDKQPKSSNTKDNNNNKANSTSSAPPNAAAVPEKDVDLDPSKLDIRCGVVVKCWDHPGV